MIVWWRRTPTIIEFKFHNQLFQEIHFWIGKVIWESMLWQGMNTDRTKTMPEHHGSATTVPMQTYFANRTGRSLVVLPSPMLPQFHSICVRSQHCCTHICNCMTAQVSCMHLPKVVGTGHCSASAHYNSSNTWTLSPLLYLHRTGYRYDTAYMQFLITQHVSSPSTQ